MDLHAAITEVLDPSLSSDALGRYGERLVGLALVVAASLGIWRIVSTALERWWLRRMRRRAPEHEHEIEREKRQHTAVTLLRSLTGYAVFASALVLAIAIMTPGPLPAVFGASLVVVLVGFGLQRVLFDIVAGVMLAFEGTYAVGDFLRFPGHGDVAGVVEQFNLRSTRIRGFNGDEVTILNGSITSVVRVARGYRDFEVELFVRTSRLARARPLVERVCGRFRTYDNAFFMRGPRVMEYRSLRGRVVTHVRIRAVVPPTLEWLVEDVLTAQLRDELGDLLVGQIQVFNLDEESYEAYRRAVILPGLRGVEERFATQLAEPSETGELPSLAARAGAAAVEAVMEPAHVEAEPESRRAHEAPDVER